MRGIFGQHQFQVVRSCHENSVTTAKSQTKKVRVLSFFVIAFGRDLHSTQDMRQSCFVADNEVKLAELRESSDVALTKIRQDFSC